MSNQERNKEIASTIISQLGGFNKLTAMTGAYNFVALDSGVAFKIKNRSANYIKIILTPMDLYDLEIGRIRGTTYKVVKSANGLYSDQLKPIIEKTTGMYLSLFEKGGEIETKGSIVVTWFESEIDYEKNTNYQKKYYSDFVKANKFAKKKYQMGNIVMLYNRATNQHLSYGLENAADDYNYEIGNL